MIQEFGDGIIRELDLGGELYNMKRLARNMEAVPGVVVPKAFPALSSSKVLTMEFLEGVKITNIQAMREADLVTNAIGEIILRALIKQLLVDGFFHADPHPGNVLVNLETGTVGFLDMGMMGEIDLPRRLQLINVLMVARQRDSAGLARAVRNLICANRLLRVHDTGSDTGCRHPLESVVPARGGRRVIHLMTMLYIYI
jgi:ubiquinone biosynthesis protein